MIDSALLKVGDLVRCDLGVCTVTWPTVPTGPYVEVRNAAGRGFLRLPDQLSHAEDPASDTHERLALAPEQQSEAERAVGTGSPNRLGEAQSVGQQDS